MKKCLIICWLGKFPEYFKAWEKSCSYNTDWDFFLFTNQKYESPYDNVIVNYVDVNEIEMLIEQKLGYKINLEYSYKLCDFKPTYGVIFEDYIQSYDYWGHCDMDLIFGKISNFITDDILVRYDKINKCGHFVLYKNNKKINKLYELPGSKFSCDEVFSNIEHYAFDEYKGMELICKYNKIKTYYNDSYVDIDVKHKRFIDINCKNYYQQLYVYDNGRLFFVYNDNCNINYEEKFYLHFQKKKPKIKVKNYKKYIVCDKGFIPYEEIVEKTFSKYNVYKGFIYEKIEVIKYYLKKIKEFLDSSFKQKVVCIKRKF